MSKTLYAYLLIFLIFLNHSQKALSEQSFQEYRVFKTTHATVCYSHDDQLANFLWRIGNLKLTPSLGHSLIENRIERIVDRVQSVLDMHPENFHIEIFLVSDYKEGNIAFYSAKTKSITVFVDRITDGILAHEVAHAVIDAYFNPAPPPKIEEILCQYADVHLWEEYR